ncbi:hypothetical protein KP509_34G051100 [Ceratopteris richardii]|uniref:Uncharacterized protein n=1 Tax=Ceratopteris richardii TaxID=49495 RepID=A0A8T2QJP4_CERRI|nr:hypothetical protein KP509_34G051100 [Ceratopteris richardii]
MICLSDNDLSLKIQLAHSTTSANASCVSNENIEHGHWTCGTTEEESFGLYLCMWWTWRRKPYQGNRPGSADGVRGPRRKVNTHCSG